jgi:hypothetical protein
MPVTSFTKEEERLKKHRFASFARKSMFFFAFSSPLAEAGIKAILGFSFGQRGGLIPGKLRRFQPLY